MPLQNLYEKTYTGCPLGIDVTVLVSGLQSDVSVEPPSVSAPYTHPRHGGLWHVHDVAAGVARQVLGAHRLDCHQHRQH